MSLDTSFNKLIKNFKFYFKLNYYRYFDPYAINHYNLINKLITYKSIGLNYLKKYPNAQTFPNLNEELFNSNPKAKEEYYKVARTQKEITKSVVNDIKIITKSPNNFAISSEDFQSFYINYDYHIGQCIDNMIEDLKKDIDTNNIN